MTEPSRFQMLVGPVVLTFGVTILRLAGELNHWSPVLFSRQPGGLGAVVGIIWLSPVVGVYFARRLTHLGHRPTSVKRAVFYIGAALCAMVGWGVTNSLVWPPFQLQVLGSAVASVAVVALAFRAWSALAPLLLWYAIGSRVPVVIIMYFAIFGRWGTHYDAFPEGFPLTAPLEIWFWAGLLVQMTFWVGITVLFGTVCGTIAAAVGDRKARAAKLSPN